LAEVARASFKAASEQLARREPVIAKLLHAAGPPVLRPPQDSHFAALVRSVLYQQLAGAAAAAIHARLVAALKGDVSPQALLEIPTEVLREVGLSANKAATLRDLSAKVADGTVALEPRELARAADEEVISRLSAVRGVGRWTAQMFLLFQLRRIDVWPTGDLGVRRGYGLAWGTAVPAPAELEALGEPFRPYRSVAAWYCWRACEIYAGASQSALTK
jgi:DNA-3-methyladenine glycosylase II